MTTQPEALQGISLQVKQGEFVTLVGQSGAGKSSLLRLIAGLIEPTAGRVERQFAPDAVGIVFQNANLMPWRNGGAECAAAAGGEGA